MKKGRTMANAGMQSIINKLDNITAKPVKFLVVQDDLKDDFKNLVKGLFDLTKREEVKVKKAKKGALKELIVEDFDEEQVWQQIELQNNERLDHLVWEIANCISDKDLQFPVKINGGAQDESSDEDDEQYQSPADENSMSENESVDNKISKNKKSTNALPKSKSKPSIVDDKFFNLQDMEQFLLSEEKKESKKPTNTDSDEESVDMFEDEDEDSNDEEGGKEIMYNDFFAQGNDNGTYDQNDDYNNGDRDNKMNDEYDDEINEENNVNIEPIKKRDKKVRFAQEMSDDSESDKDSKQESPNNINGTQSQDEKKSEFELRQQRLQQHISRLEDKHISEAPWQLKGEVDALKRPQNSLLQEVVDFDLTTRPPPIITEQTTVTLEDLIKQRVKDKAWDDVVKKEKPVNDQLSFKKTEILDHSKSKLSLAQVYEAEYLKQKQAQSGDNEDEKEPEGHTEIREAMTKLFSKLDALSHYHYTPKAPQAEVKIISNTPAISMEEVAPVATSDAALLAPEEVKKKRKGDLISKDERTQTDKNRERRKKKQLQRKKGNVTKVTEHRNTKKAVESSDKSLKTSKAFFQQLNDNTSSLLKSNKNKRNVKNKGQ